jgi:hypothetical protein
MEMAKTNLASMTIDELLKLRDDVGGALSRKVAQLRDQLSRLRRGRGSSLRRKVAVKYRDKRRRAKR